MSNAKKSKEESRPGLIQCDTGSTASTVSSPSNTPPNHIPNGHEDHDDILTIAALHEVINAPITYNNNHHSKNNINSHTDIADEDDWNCKRKREERENKRYARKVGIFHTIERGDYITFLMDDNLTDDEEALSVTTDDTEVSTSPNYGKSDGHVTFRQMYGQVGQILEGRTSTKPQNGDIMTSIAASTIHSPTSKNMSTGINNDCTASPFIVSSDPTLQTPPPQPKANLITPRTRSNMEEHNQIVITNLRKRAAQISIDWARSDEYIAPTLARRLRDFEFAQKKRRKKFGKARKWGVLGLYDFLSAVREDVDWAEDAARRRDNGELYLCWSDFICRKKRGLINRPIFTYISLFICTACLIISIGLNGWAFESFSTNPSIGPSADILLRMGAKESNRIVNHYEVWRLFTPMFLHGGLIHYFLNCFALFFVGRAVEQSHGFKSTCILFIVPAVGSTIISALFLPQYISVGASGGIFGLVGSAFADIVLNRSLLFSEFINKGQSRKHHFVVVLILLFDILANLLLGLTPYTDNFMHLGGMLIGFFCALTMLDLIDLFGLARERFTYSLKKNFLSEYFGLILCGVCIVATTAVLYSGDGVTTPCNACGVLSCVSFPPWTDYEDRWYYCDDCGRATALAVKDSQTAVFSHLNINCPNGDIKPFDLNGMNTEKEWLEENIASFCRQTCLS